MIYRKGLIRSDIHKEPLSFKIQTLLAVSDSEHPSHPDAKKPDVSIESVCGMLSSIMQFKRDYFITSEVSAINANDTEVMTALYKAEHLKRGNFSLPDTKCASCTTF